MVSWPRQWRRFLCAWFLEGPPRARARSRPSGRLTSRRGPRTPTARLCWTVQAPARPVSAADAALVLPPPSELPRGSQGTLPSADAIFFIGVIVCHGFRCIYEAQESIFEFAHFPLLSLPRVWKRPRTRSAERPFHSPGRPASRRRGTHLAPLPPVPVTSRAAKPRVPSECPPCVSASSRRRRSAGKGFRSRCLDLNCQSGNTCWSLAGRIPSRPRSLN